MGIYCIILSLNPPLPGRQNVLAVINPPNESHLGARGRRSLVRQRAGSRTSDHAVAVAPGAGACQRKKSSSTTVKEEDAASVTDDEDEYSGSPPKVAPLVTLELQPRTCEVGEAAMGDAKASRRSGLCFRCCFCS